MILRMKITSNLVFMILFRYFSKKKAKEATSLVQTANDSRTLATMGKCLEPLENHVKQRSFVATVVFISGFIVQLTVSA